MTNINTYPLWQRSLAWSVHAFTASGLVAGFLSLLAIQQHDWQMAMAWLLICQFIDGIDGTFARLLRVRQVLPHVDGKTIDMVVDFFTYAILPAYLFYEAQLAPPHWLWPCTALILIVSALYYGKEGMISTDMYFVGFPVMWNMALYYMIFIFQFSPVINVVLVIFLAILHFVPVKFVYPSQATRFRLATLFITVLFLVAMGLAVYLYPAKHWAVSTIAIGTLTYYALMAIYDTWIRKQN